MIVCEHEAHASLECQGGALADKVGLGRGASLNDTTTNKRASSCFGIYEVGGENEYTFETNTIFTWPGLSRIKFSLRCAKSCLEHLSGIVLSPKAAV